MLGGGSRWQPGWTVEPSLYQSFYFCVYFKMSVTKCLKPKKDGVSETGWPDLQREPELPKRDWHTAGGSFLSVPLSSWPHSHCHVTSCQDAQHASTTDSFCLLVATSPPRGPGHCHLSLRFIFSGVSRRRNRAAQSPPSLASFLCIRCVSV